MLNMKIWGKYSNSYIQIMNNFQITIPKDSGGSFDLNAFAVRILSVDHHAVGG